MKRSINAHEPRVSTRGGQTSMSCRCALLPTKKFNRPDRAWRYYDQHVQRAERSARRPST
jgi:hypothetical protein